MEKMSKQQQRNQNREHLSAAISPSTMNAENRTVDVVFFTSPDIQRYDWLKGDEYILRFKSAGADLSLLNNGAPVLDNHESFGGAADQKGVIDKAWQESSDFMATLRFSKRPEVDGLWRDIQDKIVQKFSMGVNLLAKSELPLEKGKLRVVEVTKWQPFEISTAPLPADNNTRTLAEEAEPDVTRATNPNPKKEALNMPEVIETTGEGARNDEVKQPPVVVADDQLNAAHRTGATAEQGRITGIIRIAKVCNLELSFAEKHIRENTSLETFRTLAIDAQAAKIALGVPDIRTAHTDVLNDEADTRRRNMAGALLERFEPNKWTYDERDGFRYHRDGGKSTFDGARSYSACSMLDIAKECLTAVNIRWHSKSRTEIAQLAFQSTSDFPSILADVANKSLRAGYEMVPAAYRQIAARRTAADFKQVKELTIDASSRLQLVPESGEFKRGKLVEGKEVWRLSTYGEIISITRQAIINDDTGAFTRTPQLLGQEVAMLEADTVYGIITTNGAMADGVALFHATHANLQGTGATISVDQLGKDRLLMLKQKSTGLKPLNVEPRFLVVPAALAQLAAQYTSSGYVAAQPSNINPLAGRLTPIVESRLDVASATAYYLFADPNTPNGVVLIYAFLEGQEGPYTETRNGFDVDGVEIKIRHDFGAAAIDTRGAVKDPGV
jgi:hypothetical protein